MAICNVNLDTPAGRHLRQAASFARFSDHGLHKMGCVIIKGSTVISFGWNKKRSHPRMPEAFSIHAELCALIRGKRNSIRNADMFVARITKGGIPATSKPCKECIILIKEAGLASVTFINEFGEVSKREFERG